MPFYPNYAYGTPKGDVTRLAIPPRTRCGPFVIDEKDVDEKDVEDKGVDEEITDNLKD